MPLLIHQHGTYLIIILFPVQLCTVYILFHLFNSLTKLVVSVTLTHEVKNSFGLAGHLCILLSLELTDAPRPSS